MLSGIFRSVNNAAVKKSLSVFTMPVRNATVTTSSNKTTLNAKKKHRRETERRTLYGEKKHQFLYQKMDMNIFRRLPRPQVIESESLRYVMEAPQLEEKGQAALTYTKKALKRVY